MTNVGLVIDQKCNIRCDHCCFASGPRSELHLSDEEVLRLMSDAAHNSDVDTIAVSGGEALLRFPLILQCAEIAKANNKRCTIMTNGFWGVTEKAAESKILMMQEAGITSMGLSVDDFHEAHIPVSRIKNCLRACTKRHLQCSVDMVVSKTNMGTALLNSLGDAVLGIPVFRYPLQRVGRAKRITKEDLFRPEISDVNLRCPGFQITYHFDGRVYPCCSPSAFKKAYSLGDSKQVNVEKALRIVKHNRLFSIMREKGFGWLMQQARKDGVDGLPSPPYVNACEVCGLLFSNPSFLSWLQNWRCGDEQ